MTHIKLPNLLLLPSFSSQDLMPDGIFLTPVSGLHYVLHIFDEAVIAIEVADQESKLSSVQEVVRRHDDRLAYLEGQHNHLNTKSELRFAASAEFDDWVLNRSEEDSLTIMGLKRLSSELGNRDWQEAAKRQVNDVIKTTLSAHRTNVDYTIVYVHNPIRNRTVGQTVLNVQLNSATASRRIRDLYSGFFRRDHPVKLPSVLKGISVRNKVTLDTRIRITIMQQLAANYKASNPNSSVSVRGYDPRPRLVTIPARGSADQPRTYTFIQAVTSLPATFSDESLARIYQVIGGHHPGLLRSLFVILNDDDRERCLGLARAGAGRPRSHPTSARVAVGSVAGHGSGARLEAGLLDSLRSPPPPPPPPPSGPPSISSEVPASDRRRSAKAAAERSGHRSPEGSQRGVRRRRESSSDSDQDRRRRSPESSKDSHRKRARRTPSSSELDSDSSRGKKKSRSTRDKRHKKTKRRSPTPSSSSSSGSRPAKSSKKKH